MVKENSNKNVLIILLVMLFAFCLFILSYFLLGSAPVALEKGEPAETFCSEKCGDYDVITSNNNSEYNFIRCECVIGVNLGDGKYFPVAMPKSGSFYFDSRTLEEISKRVVMDRISSNSSY